MKLLNIQIGRSRARRNGVKFERWNDGIVEMDPLQAIEEERRSCPFCWCAHGTCKSHLHQMQAANGQKGNKNK